MRPVTRSTLSALTWRRAPKGDAGQSMGHEAVGIVEEVGRDVRAVKRGQVVVMPFASSDGTCEFCQEGRPTACVRVGFRDRTPSSIRTSVQQAVNGYATPGVFVRCALRRPSPCRASGPGPSCN